MAKTAEKQPRPGYQTALDPSEKEKIVKRLLVDVTEYYANFDKPCPMKAMSAKYSRAFKGQFYDVIDDLTNTGKITVVMLEDTAARVIYPGKKKK